MEPRSRETTPTKEDLDFIVDDGYRHDEDPDYVPDEKYLVNNFKKELVKVLEEGLREISKSLYSIEVTIENKILVLEEGLEEISERLYSLEDTK